MSKKQKQHTEPVLNAQIIRTMLDHFLKNDKIPNELKKEFIRALKFIIKHLSESGKSLTFTQMNDLLERGGLRRIFGSYSEG